MMYTISNELIDNAVVVADSLEAAELQAYCAYGVDAIGCSIKGENGDWKGTICRRVWDELLNGRFVEFTLDDVLTHLVICAYAWVTFDTITSTEYDYREGEIEVTRLCDAGMQFIHKNDRLGNYMDEIGFVW